MNEWAAFDKRRINEYFVLSTIDASSPMTLPWFVSTTLKRFKAPPGMRWAPDHSHLWNPGTHDL